MSCAADEACSHGDVVLRLAAEHGVRVHVELPVRLCSSPVQWLWKLNCHFMVCSLLCKAHIKQCRKDGIGMMR